MNQNRNSNISFFVMIFIMMLIIIGHFTQPKLKQDFFTRELGYDVTSYYLYLPMTFIYHDPGFENKAIIDSIFEKYKPSPTFYQTLELPNGRRVPNYTCGFAYAYAPFFLIGHLWAKSSSFPADGFSFPYQFAIATGILFYLLAGWIFLRRFLLFLFTDQTTAIVMLIIGTATNYFAESIGNYLQPHAMLFSGYALLLYLTYKWHEKQKLKYLIPAGIVMGWMILSRPSDIVCIFIPLLWNISDKITFQQKLQLLRINARQLVWMMVAAFMVFIPQFLYWKHVTGQFIFFSYKNTEGFDFLKPHILNVLFSFKKSLFVYTPVLIFVVAGIFGLKRYFPAYRLSIIVYALVNFYFLASWAAWWNGGSFGMRYFVQSYAVMTIPMGCAVDYIRNSRIWVKIMSVSAIFIFTLLNLFQIWQFMHWIIPDDRMTFAYYKRIFLKTSVNDDDRKLAEVERSFAATESFSNEQDYRHFTLAHYDFDSINSSVIDPSKLDTGTVHSLNYSCKLSNENPYYPTFKIKYRNLVPRDRDHVWLKVNLWYFSTGDIRENQTSFVINMPHRKYNLKYRAFDFHKQPFVPGQWNHFTVEYMTPFPYSEDDEFEFYTWYHGKGEPVYIDDLNIEAYIRNY